VSQNRIADHAMNLLAALAAYRGKNDTVRLDLFATSEAMLTVVGKSTYHLCVSQSRWTRLRGCRLLIL
jgi:hypothetical protein